MTQKSSGGFTLIFTNVGENREHRSSSGQRGSHQRPHLVFFALTRRRSYDGTDQLCSPLANDLFGDLADLSRRPIESDHRRRREETQGLALIEKAISVVSGCPAYERLPQGIGNHPHDEAGVAWADERQRVEPPSGCFLRSPQLRPASEGVSIENDGGGIATVHVRLSSRRRNDDSGTRGKLPADPMSCRRLKDRRVREVTRDFLGGARRTHASRT